MLNWLFSGIIVILLLTNGISMKALLKEVKELKQQCLLHKALQQKYKRDLFTLRLKIKELEDEVKLKEPRLANTPQPLEHSALE